MGPCRVPKGTNTKVTSAKGPFCAYPIAVGPAEAAQGDAERDVLPRALLLVVAY